jgi:hypothetical protein
MVLSMTPEILERLRPYLSPYIYSSPKPDERQPLIAAALAEATAEGAPPVSFDEPPTLTITASAVSTGGGRFTRRAVIRVDSGITASPDQPPFSVLDWDRGME